jgi:hypothetical protein
MDIIITNYISLEKELLYKVHQITCADNVNLAIQVVLSDQECPVKWKKICLFIWFRFPCLKSNFRNVCHCIFSLVGK